MLLPCLRKMYFKDWRLENCQVLMPFWGAGVQGSPRRQEAPLNDPLPPQFFPLVSASPKRRCRCWGVPVAHGVGCPVGFQGPWSWALRVVMGCGSYLVGSFQICHGHFHFISPEEREDRGSCEVAGREEIASIWPFTQWPCQDLHPFLS